MATPETQRVNKHRRNNFDRVSILLEKGGSKLAKVLALREGVSVAELFRRALYARGGLRSMPYPDTLEKIGEPQTQAEARAAVYRLQASEESSEIMRHVMDGLSAEPPAKQFETVMTAADIAEFSEAVRRITAAIDNAKDTEPDAQTITDENQILKNPVKVNLTGREIGILRRFLANIEAR